MNDPARARPLAYVAIVIVVALAIITAIHVLRSYPRENKETRP
jgi:hypothetical protein